MTLLQINASIFSNHGQSTRLADEFVAAWRESNPGAKVIVRNLAEETVPHLDAERFGAFLAKPGERSVEQQAVEGLAIGAERKAAALSQAQRAIERLAAPEAIAA